MPYVANLSDNLSAAGVPILPGFDILPTAYLDFLSTNKLRPKLYKILSVCDLHQPDQLHHASTQIHSLIMGSKVPPEIQRIVFTSYHRLGADSPPVTVAGIKAIGDANVLLEVKEHWAKKISDFHTGISVPVQVAVVPDISGVIYTIDPVTQNKQTMVIVSGKNRYEIAKSDSEIYKLPKLIQELFHQGLLIQKHFYFPQQINWGQSGGKLYILSTRPLDTLLPEQLDQTPTTQPNSSLPDITSSLKTATKIYLAITKDQPASRLANQLVDGVCVLSGKVDSLPALATEFFPKPIIYRLSDVITQAHETNPAIGTRGAFHHLARPKALTTEFVAIKHARDIERHTNLHLQLPFVRQPQELQAFKKILSGAGLVRSSQFHLWLTVDVPANVIRLEEFIDVGIDGVMLDIDNLTMLFLGIDPTNNELTAAYNHPDPSVLWAIEKTIQTCIKRGIVSSITGTTVGQNGDLIQNLVKWGITSICSSPQAVNRIRQTISASEHRYITYAHNY